MHKKPVMPWPDCLHGRIDDRLDKLADRIFCSGPAGVKASDEHGGSILQVDEGEELTPQR